jgi:catecholate siderophore receptor
MFRVSAAALLASGFLASPALAAAAGSGDKIELAEADPIIVIGDRSGYEAKESCAATKTCTPLKDVPQSVSVITAQQIDDQALRSISDVIYFVPGASFNSGEGNRDTIVLRGNSSTADFFVDGVRDDVQYFRDFYNIDRVEVLKGPNAMIFGRGGGGGVVNRVLKRSARSQFENFALAGDSEGGFRLTADVNQPLGEALGLRVNGLYEDGDSFRRHVDLKRYGINPTVGIQAGDNTRIDLSYEYFHDRRTADRGLPYDGRHGVATAADPKRPLSGFDSIFFGDPDKSFAKVDAHIGTVAVEHDLGNGLTLRNRSSYGHFDKFYQNIFANSRATSTVTLSGYNNGTTRTNLFSQTDLVWKNNLGGIDQTLLFGFEVGRQKSRNRRSTAVFTLGANLAPLDDPTVDLDGLVSFIPSATDANNRTKATVAAIYVQDQIRPADWIEIVAGIRFDSFKLSVDDFRAAPLGGEFSRRDKFWSPRLGLILKPTEKLSFYGSFSRSYLPQSGDQFGSLDVNTEALKPERFDNYEIGAKWQPIDGLLATAAIYQLDRTNTRVANPDVPGTFLLSGKQRSKGIELGLAGNVTSRWQVSAGYALQKAEVTEATTACTTGDCKVPLVPRHTVSLWNRYDLTKQLGVGLGLIARSKSYATISNAVKLPGYARVDGALFYKISKQVEAQLNVENIFGADYFPTANSDNNIAPGAPTTVRGTIRVGI